MKYIFVSGGVVSGVGKGILASSIGLLLKKTGLDVTMIKIDPYMNVDAGTMSPGEHGEVFVLEDGGEVDLDLGNYERYLGIKLTSDHNITTGKIYQHVTERERRGDYLGKTVQIVPHLVDAIVEWIERVAQIDVSDFVIEKKSPDVCVIELGGTAGDMENAPFLEALRRLRMRAGKGNFIHVLVTLIPIIMNQEQKTKPTQAAMRDVLQTGHKPDIIACRCEKQPEQSIIDKIAISCDLDAKRILAVPNVKSTYHVPALLRSQGVIPLLYNLLNHDELTKAASWGLDDTVAWDLWDKLTMPTEAFTKEVNIALVGKYVNSMDAYMSVQKALEHAAMAHKCRLHLSLVDPELYYGEMPESLKEGTAEYKAYEKKLDRAYDKVEKADGVIVPGGFGPRGTQGMIRAIGTAYSEEIPFLGICFGMQLAVIWVADALWSYIGANSTELDPDCAHPIIITMPELDSTKKGGTMRLGAHRTFFQPDTEWSKSSEFYPQSVITERHRHRYEVNPAYAHTLAEVGLHFVAKDESGTRMEICEIDHHPFFVGVQFHPEFTSRVMRPHPIFMGFIAAALEHHGYEPEEKCAEKKKKPTSEESSDDSSTCNPTPAESVTD